MLCPRSRAICTLSERLYTVASMRQRVLWLAALTTSVTLMMRLQMQRIKQKVMKKRKRETRRRLKKRKSADALDADKNHKRKRKLPRRSTKKIRKKTLHSHNHSNNSPMKIRATSLRELKESTEKKKWLSRSLMKQNNLKRSIRLVFKSTTDSL